MSSPGNGWAANVRIVCFLSLRVLIRPTPPGGVAGSAIKTTKPSLWFFRAPFFEPILITDTPGDRRLPRHGA